MIWIFFFFLFFFFFQISTKKFIYHNIIISTLLNNSTLILYNVTIEKVNIQYLTIVLFLFLVYIVGYNFYIQSLAKSQHDKYIFSYPLVIIHSKRLYCTCSYLQVMSEKTRADIFFFSPHNNVCIFFFFFPFHIIVLHLLFYFKKKKIFFHT